MRSPVYNCDWPYMSRGANYAALSCLRETEGAEILPSPETNLFSTELPKWMAIAPGSPPAVEVSISGPKAPHRKQQNLIAQTGITNPDDNLPLL